MSSGPSFSALQLRKPETRNRNNHNSPPSTTSICIHITASKFYIRPTGQYRKDVLPLRRRPPPTLLRREDRRSRSGNRNGVQHVQPVNLPCYISDPPHSLPMLIYTAQTSRHMHPQMHSQRLPRGRPQQRRKRVPGPLRSQVLRGKCQGIGEDAGRGCAEAGWRECDWGWGHVWVVDLWPKGG